MQDKNLKKSFDLLEAHESIVLSRRKGVPEQVHVFDDKDDRSRLALKAALAAGRPLLIRGDPGVGKTQLAAAAAKALQRPLISFTVDSRCESRDLLWQFDSVRRLAEAQICGTLKLSRNEVAEQLHTSRFIDPGPLWWGFDWNGAQAHCEKHGLDVLPISDETDPANGSVVLIDEIDKADSDLPNGLLEALGVGRFKPQGCNFVEMGDPAPLVIITTNEERILPDAFVRRCLVLHLELPEDGDDLKNLLIERGKQHFPKIDEDILNRAADLLVEDRRNSARPRPGQAEYFDLVRAVVELNSETDLLGNVSEFVLKKQSGAG